MDSSNEIGHHLYDIETNHNKDERIELQETFQCSLIADNGDVIDSLNKNDENLQSSNKSQISVCPSINSLLKHEQFDRPMESIEQEHFQLDYPVHELEKTDLKDLNRYEPSVFNIEFCTTSTYLVLPQFVHNHFQSFNSFQQFWSPRVYSPKLIDSHTSENALFILLSKLILTGFYILSSCTKIFRSDAILFSFCYFLGLLFGMNAYFLIDFLLILICIISILVATYEKWLFRYINLNEYDYQLNNSENNNRYWKQMKLIAYGFAIGIISTFYYLKI
jgi:hypothetical protein